MCRGRPEPSLRACQPFIISLGPLQLTGFGIAVLLGFAIGQIIGQRVLQARGHDPTPIVDVVFASVIGFLIGAKLYFALLMGDYHALFTRGGFVFWGGLIGGIGAALFVIKRKGLSFMRIADVGGIGIAAGYGVGRTGCWAIGDDYGRPYTGPFAVSFPYGAPPSTAANMHDMFGFPIPPGMAPSTVLSVYPTQLFEVVLGLGGSGRPRAATARYRVGVPPCSVDVMKPAMSDLSCFADAWLRYAMCPLS